MSSVSLLARNGLFCVQCISSAAPNTCSAVEIVVTLLLTLPGHAGSLPSPASVCQSKSGLRCPPRKWGRSSTPIWRSWCVLHPTSICNVHQSTGKWDPHCRPLHRKSCGNNMLFQLCSSPHCDLQGTSVVSGTATAVVVCTGDDTYIASIAAELNKRKPLNAFEVGVRRVSYCIIVFMTVMVPVVILLSGFSTGKCINRLKRL